ncbi:uncharacterized protein LOC134231501 [Saccostrea cucullata]|uniref:uncharacterized protein LOC134231501 n=1 Tax=Saccostrea cuccullata TaxID=36930 RepID=UPI002ED553D4
MAALLDSIFRQRASEEELADPQFLLKQFQDDVLRASYPAMYHLVLLSCLIPSSTACVERLFSLMNTICTPLRSCLKQQSLDNIIRIVSESSGSLTPRQLTRALEHFKSSKDKQLKF